jgi:hypothetical protein
MWSTSSASVTLGGDFVAQWRHNGSARSCRARRASHPLFILWNLLIALTPRRLGRAFARLQHG